MSLAVLLKKERVRRKLSLKELGERLRSPRDPNSPVSPQYLNDIELGRRVPSAELLEQLADFFELDLSYLLALADKGHPDVDRYLRGQPGTGAGVGRVFRRAQQMGFTNWEEVERLIDDQGSRRKKK